MNIFDNSDSWEEVAQQGVAHSFRRRRCADKLIHDHFLALDEYEHYVYMLRMPGDTTLSCIQGLPEVSGCMNGVLNIVSESYFTLTLKNNEDWGIFKLLVQMLIQEVELTNGQQKALLRAINTVLSRCRSFFKKKANGLSRSQALGLIGELSFLQNYVIPAIGWDEGLSCWRGPLGSPQDFAVKDTCIEIKTTESAEKQEIKISNLEQLEPINGTGYLYVLSIGTGAEHMSGSVCLRHLVENISKGFMDNTGDDGMFKQLLAVLGYAPEAVEANRFYTGLEQTFYLLSPDFPRLTPANVPSGITSAQYTIALYNCKNFISKPDWIENDN